MGSLLLHVGYPKAASSFLQEWFGTHPQIEYHHGAIHGFRSTADLRDLAAHGDRSARAFVTSDEDLAFWRGELEPASHDFVAHDVRSVQQVTVGLLAELFPSAQVLVVTRGFASVMRSSYSQYLRVGGTNTQPDLIREQLPMLRMFWDYDHLIGLLEEAFGPDRLIVEPFEALRDDADVVLRRLAARLGIDPHPAPPPVKSGLTDAELEGYRRLSAVARRVARSLPTPFDDRAFDAYSRRLARDGFRRLRALAGGGRPARLRPFTAREAEAFAGSARFVDRYPAFAPHRRDYLLPDR